MTGLFYLSDEAAPLPDALGLPDEPLHTMPIETLRPSADDLAQIVASYQ